MVPEDLNLTVTVGDISGCGAKCGCCRNGCGEGGGLSGASDELEAIVVFIRVVIGRGGIEVSH